jgi:4-hydroxybenzoate polyprenyltransferase
VADSQNAHNPDKTQPLDAMPAAPKPPPAQMDMLKPAAPAEPKYSHDKTQPLHIIPPASLAPPLPEEAKAPAVTPPVSEHQPEKTQPMQAMPPASAPASTHPEPAVTIPPPPPIQAKRSPETTRPPVTPPHADTAQSSASPVVTPSPPPIDAAKTPAAVPTPPPRVEPPKASTPSTTVPPRQPMTRPPVSPAITSPPTQPSSSALSSSHSEPVKAAATAAPPVQPMANTASSSHSEPVKAAAPPAQLSSAATSSSHSEAAKAPAAPKDYVKTIGMMAASPPPASTPAAASAAPLPDIEQLRIPTPTSPVSDRFRWLGHKIATTAFVTEILPGAAAKLNAYAALTRLNKPIGIWLLLWPVLWALWLSSGGKPDPHVFIVFVLGTILTRSAGCAINDYADRNFDGHVKRTKNRPLVTGAVDPIEALALCAGLGLIALGLTLTLNQLAQKLTLVGGVLVVTYPFFKRFFPLPQAYLGIAFTWSVPMAYAAQTGDVPRAAIVMFLAGLAWTVAYDTMYAMVDREDDKKLGIRSSAILFGDADRFIIGIMQLMTLLGLWLIGHEMELGLWYGLGLAFAATFALYQQLLIRKRKPEDCFKAFLNNNYFGMSVFIGIFLEYTFR